MGSCEPQRTWPGAVVYTFDVYLDDKTFIVWLDDLVLLNDLVEVPGRSERLQQLQLVHLKCSKESFFFGLLKKLENILSAVSACVKPTAEVCNEATRSTPTTARCQLSDWQAACNVSHSYQIRQGKLEPTRVTLQANTH